MAIPHGKSLLGKEGGHKSQHWYDYIKSHYRLLRPSTWQGARVKTKPGTTWIKWEGFNKPE